MERTFLDTNVLVYADDLDAEAKRERAQAILDEHLRARTAVVSTQVLQEFFVVATRKLGVPPEIARRKIQLLGTLELVRIDLDMILAAVDLHRLHAFSLWDGLILRAAATAGCTSLLSEDMQHGQVIDGVRISNPFLDL